MLRRAYSLYPVLLKTLFSLVRKRPRRRTGNAKIVSTTLACVALLSSLTSCAYFRAVTFSENTRSAKLTEQATGLFIIQTSSTGYRGEGIDEAQAKKLIPPEVSTSCTNLTEDEFTKTLEMTPAAVPIVIGVASVFFDEASTAMAGYIERKKDAFTKTYGAKTTLNGITIILGEDSADKDLSCIGIYRAVKLKEKAASKTAVRLFFQFERVNKDNQNYLRIRPIYRKLDYSAALTGKDKGVNMKAKTTIRAPIVFQGKRKITTLVDETIMFPNVRPGEPKATKFGDDMVSDFFIWPGDEPLPVMLSISVTEIGSGSKEFTDYADSFTSQSKTITDALKKALEKELGD